MAKEKWGREFRAGDIVGTTFEIWLKNLLPFGFLSLIILSPVFILEFLQVLPGGNLGDAIETLLSVLLGQLLTATLVYAVFHHLRGEKVPMGECVSRGLSVLLPVMGIALLTGLIVVLGLVALIVPGIIFFCTLWVAVPAGAVEKVGVTEAMKRSTELTRNHRGSIFLVLVIMALLQGLMGAVIGFLFGVGVAATGAPLMSAVSLLVVSVLFAPLGAIPPAVGYYQLRMVKEGLGADELASVFD